MVDPRLSASRARAEHLGVALAALLAIASAAHAFPNPARATAGESAPAVSIEPSLAPDAHDDLLGRD